MVKANTVTVFGTGSVAYVSRGAGYLETESRGGKC